MIFAFAVGSPTPIPARIHLRDVAVDTSSSALARDPESSRSSSSPSTFTTLVKITPAQPALSHVDRATRVTVLRIFYEQNTFHLPALRAASAPE
jgi:hypothetical protein